MSDLAVARRTPSAPDAGATRANFDRACLLLSRRGRIPGLDLSHRDFRVLMFLLGQVPGYFAHHKTIAEALDSSTSPVREALLALREARLVLWELIPPHHQLPTGQFARTNVNRYWVNVRHLLPLLGAEDDQPTTAPKRGASTPLIPGASSGKDLRSVQDPPSTPPQSQPTPQASAQSDGEAISKIVDEPERTEPRAGSTEGSNPMADKCPSHRHGTRRHHPRERARRQSAPSEVPQDLEAVLAAWRKLKFGEPDERSIRALVNRRNDGATVEQLEAAVVGAANDEWLRRRAKVPFAVVFATLASIERFAHEGRKILEKQENQLRREAERKRLERDCLKRRNDTRGQPPQPGLAAVFASLLRPFPATNPPPTDAQVSARRTEARAKLEAWSLENGNA